MCVCVGGVRGEVYKCVQETSGHFEPVEMTCPRHSRDAAEVQPRYSRGAAVQPLSP